jgi:hypothetical protein
MPNLCRLSMYMIQICKDQDISNPQALTQASILSAKAINKYKALTE